MGDVIVYLFVDTHVTIVYIVLSYSTKSMALTLTDIGSQKSFKIEPNAERLVKFW